MYNVLKCKKIFKEFAHGSTNLSKLWRSFISSTNFQYDIHTEKLYDKLWWRIVTKVFVTQSEKTTQVRAHFQTGPKLI